MSNDTYEEKTNRQYRNYGMEAVIKDFFGASSAFVQPDSSGTIVCTFRALSCGGEETRKVIISTKHTPEQNMDLLRDALARNRWYATERESVPGLPPEVPKSEPGNVTDPTADASVTLSHPESALYIGSQDACS